MPPLEKREVCMKGFHEMTPENTWVHKDGRRYCKACQAQTRHAWEKMKKEEKGDDSTAERRLRRATKDGSTPSVKSFYLLWDDIKEIIDL